MVRQLKSAVPNSRMETQLQQLNQSFSQFSATVNSKIEEVQGNIITINTNIASINTKAQQTDERLTKLEQGGSSGCSWTREGIVDLIYPIGSIYTAFNHTDPTTLFGGTWERLQDAFLYGCAENENIGDTNFIDGGQDSILSYVKVSMWKRVL